jgi:hypothetical protein
MARTGWGSRYGYQQDNVRRDSSGGKNALITEIVNVVSSSSLVTLYNNGKTPYYGGHTTTLQYFTTGSAILQNINHVVFLSGIQLLATGAFTTSTESRPITGKIVNGPTTLAYLYTPGTLSGHTIRIMVLGKQF